MDRNKIDIILLKGFLLLAMLITASPLWARSIDNSIFHSVRIELPKNAGGLTLKAVEIFRRVANERAGQDLFKKKGNPFSIKLELKKGVFSPESFSIAKGNTTSVTIRAGDEKGILYGLGKFLHSSSFDAFGLVPGKWVGTTSPDKSFRGIYFATHFHNFYHDAPIEEVNKYVEELALWGYNGLYVWFDMHHFKGINDPAAQKMLDRLAAILKAGRASGMKTSIVMLANEGYANSPKNIRANIHTYPTYHYTVEICPSLPGGTELILKQVDEELDAFIKRGIVPDELTLWPYDQGGCGCVLCEPWGSNGYLKISEEIVGMVKKKLPKTKFILSTWLFDFEEKDYGEWRGLAKAFKDKKPFVDYLMADSHTEYPQYLLKNPVPGNLPLLNFPEISMWGNWPWGGFGAIPLPGRFQKLWDTVSDKVAGGYPYSEGIFEDANKIIYSQFYWSNQSANETMKEYVSFEFSKKYAADILEAIGILEKNYGYSTRKWAFTVDYPKKIEFASKEDFGSERAFKLLKAVDERLPSQVRKAWRWRLLYLRASLDYELRKNNGIVNEASNNAFNEIGKLQFLDKAEPSVRPPMNWGERYPVRGRAF